jgi:hypothetical protein
MFFNAFFSKRNTFLRAIKRQHKKPQRSWLEVQLLEDRCTPAGLTGQAIVTQAYQGLLDRAVDPSGLSTWGNFIDEGIPAAVAAVGIETATSQEFNEVLINQLYSTYLGRAPGASDAATWLGFLDSGGSYHEMVLLISSSDEAFTFAGGTNDTWLAALFTNALGRSIDTATQTQLDNLFTAGLDRAQIANIVLNTSEYYAHLVQTSYQTLLDRPADGPSLVFQVNALEAGFTYQDLLAGIVGSPEFASLASGPTTTSVVSSVATSVATQPVTFTATVTPTTSNDGTPTGTVSFLDNGTAIGTGTLSSNGQATFTTSALTPGANAITATYSGDTTFGTSSGTTSVTVNAAATATALTSTVNPAAFGQSLTLSATVTVQSPGSGFASGSVTFMDGTTTLGTSTINAVTGVATLAVSNLALGSHSIVATYAPNSQGNFSASTSPTLTQVINQSSSTTAISSSITPSVFGQQVTFTAIVAATAPGAGTPTGTVTFVDTTSGTTLGTATLSSGTATLAVSTLTVGSDTITANYGGDTNFTTSSGSTVQVVNQSATTTALVVSAPTAVFGESVTLTATVTPTAPGAGAPTGTVTFIDQNDTTLGTATLDAAGQAQITVSNLAVGSYTIEASYPGDTNFSSSAGSAPLTVNQAASTTTLTSDANPSVSGQSVDFTATVTATAPGAGTPTGTVTFVDTTTGTTLGTITLSGTGTAVFTTSSLSIETHTIDANYSGDTNFTLSTGSVDQVVDPVGSTTTTIASSVNPSVAGQSVTFTATVTSVQPGQPTPTGTVTFVDTTTGTTLGTGTLNGTGQATFTISTLSTETHNIQANYGGDSTYLASSASLDQVVDAVGSTTTDVVSSINPSVAGQSVTFTATVASVQSGQPTPTGTVTFVDTTTGTTLGTGTLNGSGQATFSTSSLVVGASSIAANYGGDSTFLASSGSVSQTVNKAATTTTNVTSESPTVFGQSATFTATVTPSAPGAGTPTGLVTFVDMTTGTTLGTSTLITNAGVTTAVFSTSSLTVASHTIVATYAGDGNFLTSSGSAAQTVNQAATSTALTSSENPGNAGDTINFSAVVTATAPGAGTPTGSVTFVDTTTNTTLGTVALDNTGTAVFSTSSLAAGSHTIVATYEGSSDFLTSNGNVDQTIS